MGTASLADRVGCWFLRSGIQDTHGGVARYYRSDLGRNYPISTEITGYAASTYVYLHALTGRSSYLERAAVTGRFLARAAWDPACDVIPFEYGSSINGSGPRAYFFDSGIIVRGLLAVWRATGEEEFLGAAVRAGRVMLRDFAAGGEFHPILELPSKVPLPRDPARWSRSPGCYQLKSAMAWSDLAAAGEREFAEPYRRTLESALAGHEAFLPGHPERAGVMDRLHAYCYFLEGMLPCAGEARCAAAAREGIARVASYVREIAPEFVRSDVYAQLLRARLFADWNGVLPLDREAAAEEAAALAAFECGHPDPRMAGGFWFGRKSGEWLPYVNPVSAGFALQALAMWEQHLAGRPAAFPHLLI